MRISVIASLIVAVHVAVVVTVMAPGCTTVKRNPPVAPAQPGQIVPTVPAGLPDIPPMPPVVEPVQVPPATVLPPVVAPVDVPEAPAADNIYVVQRGDSLSKIVVKHGVKAADIAELNGIKDANKILVGQKLLLPAYASPSQSKPEAGKASGSSSAKKAETTVNAAGQTEYVVKSGDALSKIAKAFGVKQSAIMEANGIKDANKIRIGQKLVIPAADAASAPAKKEAEKEAPAAEAAAPEAATEVEAPEADALPELAPEADAAAAGADNSFEYSVAEGETLESIERVFTLERGSLARYNGLAANAELKPNQKIRIPPAAMP